ncbi:hypothetical protein GX441_09170 [bacterium]|nr:hypothetical protein [bacterium]
MKKSSELFLERREQTIWARRIGARFAQEMKLPLETIESIDCFIDKLATHLVMPHKEPTRLSFRSVSTSRLHGMEITANMTGNGQENKLFIGYQPGQEITEGGNPQRNNFKTSTFSTSKSKRLRVEVCTRLKGLAPTNTYVVHEEGKTLLVGIVEGRGTSLEAHNSAVVAESYILSNSKKPLERILKEIDLLVNHDPGVSVALARIDVYDKELQYAATGDLESRLWVPDSGRWIDLIGMEGVRSRHLRLAYEWRHGSVLLMLSNTGESDNLLSKLETSTSNLAHQIIAKMTTGMKDAVALVVR